MSETPRSKGPDQQTTFIEIEAPEELTKEQNFYDQPPFDDVLKTTSAGTGVEIEKLRQLLSFLLNPRTTYKVKQRSPEEGRSPEEQMLDPRSLLVTLVAEQSFASGERDQFRQAIRLLGAALGDFPYWADYIGTRDDFFYRADGSYSPRRGRRDRYVPTLSYAK